MSRDTFGRAEVIFKNSLDTYLHEAKRCIDCDLGYPAVLMMDVVLRFVADLKGQQVRGVIAQMTKFPWFLSQEKDRRRVAELVCTLIDHAKTIPTKQRDNPSRVIMVRDRNRIDNDLILGFDILILDEFLLELKDLALDEVARL